MTGVALLGAGLGAGAWALIRALFPPRPDLEVTLRQLREPPRRRPPEAAGEPAGWAGRAGRPAVRLLVDLGLPTARVRADLAVLDRDQRRHLAEQATAAVLGLLAPPAVLALLALGGVRLPWALPGLAAPALAAAGFLAPDLAARAEAAKRRAEFRHALSATLDLVVIALAGGAGVDGALDAAVAVGDGWPATQLRRALREARLGRTPPWVALGALGERLGVPELVETAASVALAGAEGAKVRASLAAKAAALRQHQASEAEAAAQAATERMSLPVVALFAAFLLFIGYPAVVNVLAGL